MIMLMLGLPPRHECRG